MNDKKKEIKEYLNFHMTLDEVIYGSLQETANRILSIKKKLKHEKPYIDFDKYHKFEINTGYDDFYDTPDICIMGIRYETDEEFQKRVEKQIKIRGYNKKSREKKKKELEKQKEQKENEEFKLYLKLHKKYATGYNR